MRLVLSFNECDVRTQSDGNQNRSGGIQMVLARNLRINMLLAP